MANTNLKGNVLDLNQLLLTSDERKKLAIKENKVKQDCRNNISPFKTKLQKKLVWLHILNNTDI